MRTRVITKRLAACAFAVVLSLLLPSINGAQQGNVIRGKVRNSDGAALSRVTVELQTGNGAGINQTVTNNEGDFAFTGLSETSYVLVIFSPDYNPINEHVDFFHRSGDRPGETRMVELTLTRANISGRTIRTGATFVQNVPKAARDAFERAVKLSKENKAGEAQAAIDEAIRIFPDYFDAHFARANEFIRSNRINEATTELEQARRINPKDDRTYELFGLVLMQQGKFAVAAAVLAEASRLNPLDPQYSLMRGMALIEQASTINASQSKQAENDRVATLNDAETSLKHAYELSGKKLAAAHLQLARVYEKRGQRAQAINELEQYLREAPDAKNADAVREGIKKLREPVGK